MEKNLMKRTPLFLLIVFLLVGLMAAIVVQPAPAGTTELDEYEVQVVRAYYDDPALVAEVASWTEPWEVNRREGYIVLEVNPAEFQRLVDLGFRVEVDLAATEAFNQLRVPLPNQGGGIPGYPCYRTVEETFQSAVDMVTNYPNLATWIDVGDSWEKTIPGGNPGYDMMVLRLTNSAIPGPKPVLFATTAIHAREYTTAELATRYAEYLLANYGLDPDVTWILDYHEIHLMLQTNPDGRKKAETGLSWRKNTNENYCSPTSNNRGADLNRNFEFQWGCCGGSSGDQCNLTYRGPSPASEPEVQAVQAYGRSIFPDQRGDPLNEPAPDDATGVYLDIHSYSELVLWPWGFTGTPTGNGTQLQTLGRKLAYFNSYFPEQAIGLYPTDGTTDDFFYGDLGVASYTFELGTAFFQSCATFENVILPDNLDALLYTAKVVRTPYMTPAGPEALQVNATPGTVAPGTLVDLTATINDTRFNNQNGSEPVQNIVAAEYYINVPPWITDTTPIALPMTAVDGNFNSTIEDVEATIDTTGLATGRHTIFVRGQDNAGNWGPFSAVFLYVIDPAVAPTLEGYVREAGTNMPLAASVSIGGQFTTQTDPATGFYQTQVVSGTYDITASASDHGSETVAGVALYNLQTVQQDFDLTAVCPAFSDDVEGGNIGWTAQGFWAITQETANSPTHSWTDSPGGNYNNNTNYSLISPPIDLSGYSDVMLNYWQICDTEAGWDYCYVEVSTNGSTWDTVAAFDGNHFQWEEITLPLPQLDDAAQARIRFRLDTDVSITDDGWHVDDINLLGASAACVPDVAPTAGFTSNSPVRLGDPVEFTNTSTGTNLSFAWDFGDGSPISTEEHPTYTYTAAMTYTVVLTAQNNLGTDVYTDTVVVLDEGIAPTASFTVSPEMILAGRAAQFNNTSQGTDLTFSWDFGDGSPLVTDTNPVHIYAAPGFYTVTLTATNDLGSDSFQETITVWVRNFLPLMHNES
jgi:PKD repeat protein